jgi:hypothetical protein
VTSDPGVPQTFEATFFGPEKELWRLAIYYEELMSFSIEKFSRRKTNNK